MEGPHSKAPRSQDFTGKETSLTAVLPALGGAGREMLDFWGLGHSF